MPRITNIALFWRREQYTLSLSFDRLSVTELSQKISETYTALSAYLQELNEQMEGNPFVAYHRIEEGEFTVEIGFVVARALPSKSDIKSSMLPAGKVVWCMFRGPYNEMTPVYREMESWVNEHDLKITGSAYEYYYNGPDFPAEDYLTKIVMPVE